jgi:elongator complex protein 6
VLVNADSPLVSRTRTKLEIEAASLVTTLAHQASTVTSLRMLDTGLAKDVSGVLRVTRRHDLTSTPTSTNDQEWNEKEVLYFVKDGSVEVFGRGEMRT